MWNCLGVGSHLTIPHLKESITLHSLNIVILSETKNKKAMIEKVRRRIQYEYMQVVETVGKAWGMAAFWRTSNHVQGVNSTTFTLAIKIRNLEDGTEWWCIRVYASTLANIRQRLWEGSRMVVYKGVC